jgi:hypothetical protein
MSHPPARVKRPDEDLAVVHDYSRQMKIACDDLHDDPFDTQARARLIALIKEQGPIADAAVGRLQKATTTGLGNSR